jgi:hypothetical protein
MLGVARPVLAITVIVCHHGTDGVVAPQSPFRGISAILRETAS